MKSFQTTRITAFILTIVFHVMASATPIIGKVTDAGTGEAIIGATVYDPRAHQGVTTDAEGKFSIDVTAFPSELKISFVGYELKSIQIKGDDEDIVVALKEESHKLDEVVVVGYGTQKRTKLTGSVVSVSSDIIKNSKAPTIDGLLSGAVAGVSVTTNGQPGAASSIRIRGGSSVNANNDPLYVVDGFIYYADAGSRSTGVSGIQGNVSPLAFLNPDDIESMEVLKDVSATAIYGSRGANGVIIITTKKGHRDGVSIKYNYSFGVGNSSKRLSLLNAQEFAQFQKQYFYNKEQYTDEQIAQLGSGTDWQDAVLRTAHTHSHSVSVSGGNERTRYAVSGNMVSQEGIIINSGYKKAGLRLNLDTHFTEWLSAGVTANVNKSKQDGLTTTSAASFNSSPYSAGITSSLTYALFMPPTQPVYEASGEYNYHNPYEYAYFALGDHAANPVSDLENSVAQSIDDSAFGNLYLQYHFAEGWTAKASFGFNLSNITQNFFAPSYTAIGLQEQGIGSIGKRRSETWQTEYTIGYNRQLNKHHFVDLLVGYTYQSSERSRLTSTSNHYANQTLKHNNLAGGSEYYAPQSGSSEATLHSLIARVNYTLNNRYNLTATLRADHSSRFAEHHKWGYFPSLGLSWNIDQEQWLKRISWISELKIRASVGTVGNQEIGDYEYADSYSASSYGNVTAYQKSNEANDNLKWETIVSYNVGFDLGLWNNKVRIVADAYYKKTNDLLLRVPVNMLTYGVSSQLQNIGNVTNKGIELSVNYTPIQRKDLTLTIAANGAHNVNRITNVAGFDQLITGNTILRKDEAIGSFFGLVFDGIVQLGEDRSKLPTQNGLVPEPGQEKFKDLNGDGKVDLNDRTIIGKKQPDNTFGFSTTLSYKAWDFFLQCYGTTGGSTYNSLRRALEHPTDCYNVSSVVLDAWTESNPSNTIPKVSDVRPYSTIDDRYVEKTDFLKLKTLAVGYTLRIPSVTKRVPPISVRLSLTASNLLTITGYKGYDPEVGGGVDTGIYPVERTITFGVGLTL